MKFPCLSTRVWSRLARIIGLLGLAASLAACSAIKLGYNNIDEVAYWWLDSYVDFTSEQASLAREDLTRLHRWHRVEELPRLVTLLRAFEDIAPRDVTAAQVCEFVPQLRDRFDAVTQRAEPAVVTMALGLASDQISHLERKYERKNTDYRKDWLEISPAAQKEKRFDLLLDRAEMIYGRLESVQRDSLQKYIDQSKFDAQRELGERMRRQQDALQTLRKLAGQPVAFATARTLLRGFLERAQAVPDAVEREHRQGLIEESCRGFAALHNSTTPVQRQAAVGRLRAYQRDLRELTAAR